MPIFSAAAASLVGAAGFTAGTTSFLVAQSVTAAGLAYTAGRVTGVFDEPSFSPIDSANFEDQGVDQRIGANTQNRIPLLYGTWMTRGIVSYYEVSEDRQTLYAVLTLGEDAQSIDKIYWDDFLLTLDSNGEVTDAVDRSGVSTDRLNGQINVQTYPAGGRSTYLEDLSSTWNSNCLMSDLCYVVVTVRYNRDKDVTGLSDMRFVGQGNTSNPAVAVKEILEDPIHGLNLFSNSIDTNSFNEAEEYYDSEIFYINTDGNYVSRKRFEVNGALSTQSTIGERIDEILRGSNSSLKWSNGKYGIFVNKKDDPTSFVFNNQNIVGNISISEIGFNNLINSVQVNYGRDSDNNWQRNTLYVNSSLTYPNEGVRTHTIELPLVKSSVEAEYVANVLLNQSRQQLAISHRADATAMPLEAGDVVSYDHADYGWSNKLFRVLSISEVEEDGALAYDITAVEYADAVYNATLNEVDVSPNVPEITPDVIGAVDDLSIDAVVPSSQVPYVTLGWTVPDNSLIEAFDIFANNLDATFDSPATVLIGSTRPSGTSNYSANSNVSFNLTQLTAGTWTLWVVGRNDFARSGVSNSALLADWNPFSTDEPSELVFRFHENFVDNDPGEPFGSNGTGGGWLVNSNDPHWQAVTFANHVGAERRIKTFDFSGTAGSTVSTVSDDNREIDVTVTGQTGMRKTLLEAQPEITEFEFSGTTANVDTDVPTIWNLTVPSGSSSDGTAPPLDATVSVTFDGDSSFSGSWDTDVIPLSPFLPVYFNNINEPDDTDSDAIVYISARGIEDGDSWQDAINSAAFYLENNFSGNVDDEDNVKADKVSFPSIFRGFSSLGQRYNIGITNRDKTSYAFYRAHQTGSFTTNRGLNLNATGTVYTLLESGGTFDSDEEYCLFITPSTKTDLFLSSFYGDLITIGYPRLPFTNLSGEGSFVVIPVPGSEYDGNQIAEWCETWLNKWHLNSSFTNQDERNLKSVSSSGNTVVLTMVNKTSLGESDNDFTTEIFDKFATFKRVFVQYSDFDMGSLSFTTDVVDGHIGIESTQLRFAWDSTLDPNSTTIDLGNAPTSADIAEVIQTIIDVHPELSATQGSVSVSGNSYSITGDASSRNVVVVSPIGSYTEPTFTLVREGTNDDAPSTISIETALQGAGSVDIDNGIPTSYSVIVSGTTVSSGNLPDNASSNTVADFINTVIDGLPDFTSSVSSNVVTATTTTNTGADPISVVLSVGVNGAGLSSPNDARVVRTRTQQGSSVETFVGQDGSIEVLFGGIVRKTLSFSGSSASDVVDDLVAYIDSDGTYDGIELADTIFRATAQEVGTGVPALSFNVDPGRDTDGSSGTLMLSVDVRNTGQNINVLAGRLTHFNVIQGLTTIVDGDIPSGSTPTEAAAFVASTISGESQSRYTATSIGSVLTLTSNFFDDDPDIDLSIVEGLDTDNNSANMNVVPVLVQAGAQGMLDLTDSVWQYFVINQEPRIDTDLLMIDGSDNQISVRRGLVLDTTTVEASSLSSWATSTTTHTTGSRNATLVIIGAANAISRTTTTSGAYVAAEMEYSDDGGSTWNALTTSAQFGLTYGSPFDNDVVTPALNLVGSVDADPNTIYSFRARRDHSNSGDTSIGWSILVLEELRA